MFSKIKELLFNKTTPCTTTTRATSPAAQDMKENRSKLITPMWKRTSKFMYKDFRSRLTSGSNFDIGKNILFNMNILFLFLYLSLSFNF